jgi:putative phosphoribosyl transferase
VLAIPVAPPDALEKLRADADNIVYLVTPEDLGAIGFFYCNFQQLSDEDVVDLLVTAAARSHSR